MNPVFAVDFMNHPEGEKAPASAIFKKPVLWITVGAGILLDLLHFTFVGNPFIFIVILVILNRFFIDGLIHRFQNKALPWIMSHYENLLRWALKGWRPVYLLLGTFGLLIFSFVFFGMRKVPVVFSQAGIRTRFMCT
jgi:hypothetical protein